MINKNIIQEIQNTYLLYKDNIIKRLKEFKTIIETGRDEDIFIELIFCLLTPQSKAKTCWITVEKLKRKNLIFHGEQEEISKEINIVRFKNNKARYIINARKKFIEQKISLKSVLTGFDNIYDARNWLAFNIKGLGYKEASHFLRNIGLGENIAILDRHILKNLKSANVINEIPKTISKKKYLEIEKAMIKFSNKIKIPPAHLDFVLWCRETGEIFK